jgi:hypothetical protein
MKRALVQKLLILTENIHFDRKHKTKAISSQPGNGACVIIPQIGRGYFENGLLNN